MNQNCFCYSGSKESFSHKKNNLFKLNNFLDPKWFFFVIFFWFHFVTLFGCFLHFLICWKQILLNFKRKHHFKLKCQNILFWKYQNEPFWFFNFFCPKRLLIFDPNSQKLVWHFLCVNKLIQKIKINANLYVNVLTRVESWTDTLVNQANRAQYEIVHVWIAHDTSDVRSVDISGQTPIGITR